MTADTKTPRDCKHGQLARTCYICELERELAKCPYTRMSADLKPTCAVCGRTEPCELDKDEMSPCTFDPSPRQLYEDNCKLRAERDALQDQLERRTQERDDARTL